MPKFTSDTFLKTGKRRHPDSGSTEEIEPNKDEILKTCIVCQKEIPSGRNGLDKFDIKYHYTECYIQDSWTR